MSYDLICVVDAATMFRRNSENDHLDISRTVLLRRSIYPSHKVLSLLEFSGITNDGHVNLVRVPVPASS